MVWERKYPDHERLRRTQPPKGLTTPMTQEPLLTRAYFGQATERTPIWMMRQAGRYMASYRDVRAKVDFLTLCHSPELACEVTLQPIEAFGFDASILFSDLLLPLEAMGASVSYPEGGPVVTNGVEVAGDVDGLRTLPAADTLGYVAEAVKLLVRALPANVPLIGFAGAPFTLATYLIKGGGGRSFLKTKRFMYEHPEEASRLFDKLTTVVTDLLRLQIDAGCQAVQIFDSWAGSLDPYDYARWGQKYTRRIVEGIDRPGVPIIVFAKGTGTYIELVRDTGADALGVDWTLPLDEARKRVGPGIGLQGNLDPARLLGDWPSLRAAVDRVLDAAGDGTGHVFNLGHGITPETPPDRVRQVVEYVQSESPKRRAADFKPTVGS